MKKYVLFIALLVASTGTFAQNRVVKKAQGLINLAKGEKQKGQPLDMTKMSQAKAFMDEAMSSGETKDMALAWNVQAEMNQLIFMEELNKAAAKQPFDTLSYMNSLLGCLNAYEECHKVDEKQEYEAANKENMIKYRMYLMYGGQFWSESKNYGKAYEAYDAWLKYPQTYTMVANEPKVLNDSVFDKDQVAYYACLTAYQGKLFDKVSEHLEEALKYTAEAKTVRQLHLATLQEQGDTAQWVEYSKKYAPEDEVIAQNLLAYYTEKKDNAASLAFADELLAKDPNNKIANYSKGVVLFGEEKFEEALPFFEKSGEIDPTFTDAFYNAGVCCCNAGYNINEQIGKKKLTQAAYNKEIETVKDWYKRAEPFFIKVRELEPENPQRWASRLKTVYYITGEKAKEAEMDNYLK